MSLNPQELLRRAEEHQAERLRIEIVGLREQLEQEVAARGQLQAQLDSRCDDSRKRGPGTGLLYPRPFRQLQ